MFLDIWHYNSAHKIKEIKEITKKQNLEQVINFALLSFDLTFFGRSNRMLEFIPFFQTLLMKLHIVYKFFVVFIVIYVIFNFIYWSGKK